MSRQRVMQLVFFAEDPAVEVHRLLTWKSSSYPVKRHDLSIFIHP